MTPKICQQVIPRRRSKTFHFGHRSNSYSRYYPSSTFSSRRLFQQRGAINSTTLTLSLIIVIFLAVAVLAFFYLGQVMNTAAQGSDISQLEDRLIELKTQQRELELEGARLRSIQTVEQEVKELNLVSTDKVAFIQGLNADQAFAAAE